MCGVLFFITEFIGHNYISDIFFVRLFPPPASILLHFDTESFTDVTLKLLGRNCLFCKFVRLGSGTQRRERDSETDLCDSESTALAHRNSPCRLSEGRLAPIFSRTRIHLGKITFACDVFVSCRFCMEKS